MKLYCTLTRSKREFTTIMRGHVGIYVCGPTVYNYAHIGNARPYVVFDVLRRHLEYNKYTVNYVQNFTDIDDKIINAANAAVSDYSQIANKYIQEFRADMQGLNVLPATHYPRVTEEIPEIIALVSRLINSGYAYEVDGTVYFRAPKAKDYGKLSKKNIDDLEAGARVDINTNKENPSDFVLWKAAKPGEPSWDSPWGDGRPGWHIECSAMARKYIGNSIDIHCGGEDLIFPHHENEIAQSEADGASPFANFWLHNGMIAIDRQKMSKSSGNFFTIREIADKFPYPVLRFFILSVHYRSPLNFSEELLTAAAAGLERIANCLRTLWDKRIATDTNCTQHINEINTFFSSFEAALNNDLNTANAISAIFDLVKFVNINIETAGHKFLSDAVTTINKMLAILGLELPVNKHSSKEGEDEIETLITERNEAKAAKDFTRADGIRTKLTEMGVTIKDTREGTTWHYTHG